MKRVALFVGVSLSLAIGLAACSSDSSSTTPATTGAGGDSGSGGSSGSSGKGGSAGQVTNQGGSNGQGTGGSNGQGTGGTSSQGQGGDQGQGGTSSMGTGGTNPFGGGTSPGGSSGAGGSGASGAAGSTGSCAGGIPAQANACGQCEQAQCCTESTACENDADCKALIDCYNTMKCADATCLMTCDSMHAAGKATLGGLESCVQTKCAMDCSSSSGICDSKVTTGDAGCDMCVGADAGCCQATKDCVGDADCKDCLTNAMADQAKCAMNTKKQAVDMCFGATCKDACGGGSGGSGGSSGQGCGFKFQQQTCTDCFDTNCCDQGAACAGDMACVGLNNCLVNCAQGDMACQQSCVSMNQSGVAKFQAIQMCVQSSCKTECGG